MTRAPWIEVRSVLESVLELPPAERKPYLDRACPEPELRRYVDSLLASFEQASSGFLDIPAAALADPELTAEPDWAGRRIGPYQILNEIAHGGMGAVYRAVRADQQYERQVAIKVIRAGVTSALTLARFRAERQILANLDHANIARLLDGGAEDHSPYFVMELVEGVPIDRYCREQNLSVPSKLALFRTVCSAVQHAHHNLIVHRDLKPGNILVTSDGTPKLLDFGIAKILDPEHFPGAPEATAPMLRLLTLEYASPEQVRGEPITTSTDVYSLGVVLYVLLTERLPYPASDTAIELATAICQTEPNKPSSLVLPKHRRAFPADLDTVLLKALQKDPRRRYSSVEQFSEDLRRCLEGLPVSARPDTLSYRAGRFVRRHTSAVIAAALVMLALITGLIVTLREARIAEAQSRRADQRFADVRKLANSLIFELHDAIKDLPGATPARKLLIDRAVQYLDGLAKEAGVDSSFKTELGWAYQRLALLQGDTYSSNLGDHKAGLASIHKASTLWDQVAQAKPDNIENQLDMAYGHRVVGNMSATVGEDGAPDLARAIAICERLQQTSPDYPRLKRELSREYGSYAELLEASGRSREGLGYLRKEYAIQSGVLKSNPKDRDVVHAVAMLEVRLSSHLANLGEFSEAMHFSSNALHTYRELATDLTDASMRRELAFVLFNHGQILLFQGDPGAALEQFRESVGLISPLAAADPQNALFEEDLAGQSQFLGSTLVQTGRIDEGLSTLARALEILQHIGRRDSSSFAFTNGMAFHASAVGEALALKRDFAAALRSYDESVRWFASQKSPRSKNVELIDVAAVQVQRGAVLARLGRIEEARVAYQQAISLSQPWDSGRGEGQATYTIADAYFGLGNLSRRNASQAQAYYDKSLEQWQRIGHPAGLSPDGFPCGDPNEVARARETLNRRGQPAANDRARVR